MIRTIRAYMSHPGAISPRSAMIRGMSRLAFAAVIALAGCTGCVGCSKAQKDGGTTGGAGMTAPKGGGDQVAVPGGDKVAVPGGDQTTGAPENNAQFRLSPDEGKLAIELPVNAKPGAEVSAKIVLTAADKYKVNEEFPTKLTLETTKGVTLSKAVLKAGGSDKDKGDADVFNDKQLAFVVKLTPAENGTYTINGNLKFAVCDRAGSQCLPKKEPIAIQVAAK